MLLSGQRDAWLAENPPGTRQPSTRCLWWPPGRAVGHLLARQIAAWDPAVDHQSLPALNARGRLVRAAVALGCTELPRPSITAGEEAALRTARMRDIANRQVLAVERREREAEADLRAMSGAYRHSRPTSEKRSRSCGGTDISSIGTTTDPDIVDMQPYGH